MIDIFLNNGVFDGKIDLNPLFEGSWCMFVCLKRLQMNVRDIRSGCNKESLWFCTSHRGGKDERVLIVSPHHDPCDLCSERAQLATPQSIQLSLCPCFPKKECFAERWQSFSADLRQAEKNSHREPREAGRSLNLPSAEKTNTRPDKMLIQHTDGSQNTGKTTSDRTRVCVNNL